MNGNNPPSTASPQIWSNLTRHDLAKLYRQIRQALILGQSSAVTDNSNVVGVRLRHDEKRCLEVLARLNRHKVSDELRKAIRTHLQRHQQSIVRIGGLICPHDDDQDIERVPRVQAPAERDSRPSLYAEPDDGGAAYQELDGLPEPDDLPERSSTPVWICDYDLEGELTNANQEEAPRARARVSHAPRLPLSDDAL